MPVVDRFLSKRVSQERHLLNVGGEGDCGFRSIAAGIIDNFLVHRHFDASLLNRILVPHFKYYPSQEPKGMLAPRATMLQLLNTVPPPELVKTLAFSLRQLAVDELNRDPVSYPGAFVSNNEKTSPRTMRQARTWIDESAIAALAHSLSMPIEVQLSVPGKALPCPPFLYAATRQTMSIPKVVIQLESKHYRPMLLDPEPFKSSIYAVPADTKPVEHKGVADKDLPEVMRLLEEQEKRITAEFEILRNQLAANLTTQELLNIFIKGMTVSDYLQGRVKCVDEERGDRYFSMALAAGRGIKPVSHVASSSCDDALKAELCHAIARAVSIGHMNKEDVFAEVENESRAYHR